MFSKGLHTLIWIGLNVCIKIVMLKESSGSNTFFGDILSGTPSVSSFLYRLWILRDYIYAIVLSLDFLLSMFLFLHFI